MKNLAKIEVKRREKDRPRPVKDKKGHFKLWPSFKENIQKKDAAPPLVLHVSKNTF
jgi:hypothetical protein